MRVRPPDQPPPVGSPASKRLSPFFFSFQLGFDLDREVYPLVVHAVVDEGDGTGASCLLRLLQHAGLAAAAA